MGSSRSSRRTFSPSRADAIRVGCLSGILYASDHLVAVAESDEKAALQTNPEACDYPVIAARGGQPDRSNDANKIVFMLPAEASPARGSGCQLCH